MRGAFTLALAAAFALPSYASIPPEFLGLPTTTNHLKVHYPKGMENTPVSQHYGSNVPAHAPKLSVDMSEDDYNLDPSSKYVVAMIDPDFSHSKHGQYIHWLAKNLHISNKPSSDKSTTVKIPKSEGKRSIIVPYKASQPQKLSDPHHYILYLFKQPKDGFFSSNLHKDRASFDISEFAEDANLGDPVAANWFICSAKNRVPDLGATPHEQLPLEKRAKIGGKSGIGIGRKLLPKNRKNHQQSSTSTHANPSASSMSSAAASSTASAASTGGAGAMVTTTPARGMAAAALGAAGMALAL